MTVEADDLYRHFGLDHLISRALEQQAGAAPNNVFRCDGDIWSLTYAGRQSQVQHVKGMDVLVRLLAEPGREFHVLDLTTHPGGLRQVAVTADTGEVIDEQARVAFKRRLFELEEELDEAAIANDPARAEHAQAEHDALVHQLAEAYGIGGRVRRGNDPVERMRSTVTKQIHAAIGRVGKADPSLGRHLANSVKTGRYCRYAPEHPVSWTTEPRE